MPCSSRGTAAPLACIRSAFTNNGQSPSARRRSASLYRVAVLTVSVAALVSRAIPAAAQPRGVTLPCDGGYQGLQTGTIVAVMPPDVPSPTGGLTQPGMTLRRAAVGSVGVYQTKDAAPHVRCRCCCWCAAGGGANALVLGDTVGRTPGAYGFVVSCPMDGYLNPKAVVQSGTLVLHQSAAFGINPLSNQWTSSVGPGPAQVLFTMVRG